MLACATSVHSKIRAITLGQSTYDQLSRAFSGEALLILSSKGTNAKFTEKNYTICVQFDDEAVYGFQAFGNIPMRDIEVFISQNKHFGAWKDEPTGQLENRYILNAQEFLKRKSVTEGRYAPVQVFRKAITDGDYLLEYWVEPGSPKTARFFGVHMRDKRSPYISMESLVHKFAEVTGDALCEDFGNEGRMYFENGQIFGMRAGKEDELVAKTPEVNGYEITTGSEPYPVRYLGYFDYRSDGLAVAHTISIWNYHSELVHQVKIPAGEAAQLNGNFRWIELKDPVMLEPKTTYYLMGTTHQHAGKFDYPARIKASHVDGSHGVQISGKLGYWAKAKQLKGLGFPTHEGNEWLKIGPNIAADINFAPTISLTKAGQDGATQ